jgi:hypothetical protein
MTSRRRENPNGARRCNRARRFFEVPTDTLRDSAKGNCRRCPRGPASRLQEVVTEIDLKIVRRHFMGAIGRDGLRHIAGFRIVSSAAISGWP